MLLQLVYIAALCCGMPSAQACGEAGSTCSAPDPATQGASGPVNVGAGNPINVVTGNKYQREVDMPALPGVLGLEIVRHYNSVLSEPGQRPRALGRGWRLSYESELFATPYSIEISQADGSLVVFSRDLLNRNRAVSSDPARGTITVRRGPRGDEYLWTWTDGRKLSFDNGGRLQQIQASSGEILSLLYDRAGRLARVTDPQGRSMTLAWLDQETARRGDRFRGVQSISSPVGKFTYAYGSAQPPGARVKPVSLLANLVQVRYPASAGNAALGRIYHFEDPAHPTLLTGISIVSAREGAAREGEGKEAGTGDGGAQTVTRYATYAYQADGKAILSSHADKHNLVRLSYAPGQTTVTNSLGQSTLFRHALIGGEYRVLEVRGAGCAQCTQANRRYRYDQHGRLTETVRIDSEGQPLEAVRQVLDQYGRPLRIVAVAYAGGAPQAPRLLQRFEYAAGRANLPTLIARPSVVAGRETVTRIGYNQAGQPLSVSDSGWSPAPAFTGEPAAISRTTRYSYRSINGRSLAVLVDGPLKNGRTGSPADSDVTRIDYDRNGNFISQVIAPGMQTTRFAARTEAGWPSRVVEANGVETLYGYERGGRVVSRRAPGTDESYRYAALGGIARMHKAGGESVEFAYNAAGQLVGISDAQNNRIGLAFDTEDKLLSRTLFNPDGSVAQSSELSRFVPDSGADGMDSLQVSDLRQPALVVHPPVVQAPGGAQLQFDPAQRVTAHTDARKLRTGYVYDDFGRLVRVDSPDGGVTVFTYDEAGQLAARTTGYGTSDASTIRYRYDVAGRVVEQTSAEGRTAIAYGAQGRPTRIAYPGGEEHFVYDKAGRLTAHTRLIDKARFITSYHYDERGQLVRKTLPDGQVLNYRYNGAMHAKPGLLAGITRQDLLGETSLLKGLNDADDSFVNRRHELAHGVPYLHQLDQHGQLRAIGSSGYWIEQQERNGDGLLTRRHGRASTDPFDTGMAYDDVGRLIGIAGRAYTYDPTGNLLEQIDGARRIAYRVSPSSNRIASVERAGEVLEYAYNGAGSVTAIGATRYVWDSQQRLVKIEQQGRPIAEYVYNAFGERIKKISYANQQRKVTYYFYDGAQLVAEAQPDEGAIRITRQYVWLEEYGQARPIALLESQPGGLRNLGARSLAMLPSERAKSAAQGLNTRVYAIVADHTGAPRALVNDQGRSVWRGEVRGFGEVTVAAGSELQLNLRGSAQYADVESGLHYNHRRYLDTATGRYLSADPTGQAGGTNLYAYADNNPVDRIDPLGLQAKPAGPVSNWSFADKLVFVIKAVLPKLPLDLQNELKLMISGQNIATTAAIFSLWAGSHALGIGFAFDGLMLGVAYYMLGKAAADVIMGLIETTIKINNAKCENDLDAAASTLSKALSIGARGFVEGALLKKIFSKTEGDLGATAIEQIKRSINYAKGKVVGMAGSAVKLGFRARAWNLITDNHEKGFIGELDAWSYLMSGKLKMSILGNKTIDPTSVRTQAEYNAALAAYRGTKGVDGAFESKPGFFRALIGGKPTLYVVESKATAGVFPAQPSIGILKRTTTGALQMSETWLGEQNNRRLVEALGDSLPVYQAAKAQGRVRKVLALTDRNGTRYFEIHDVPNRPGEVTIGADITSLFK